MKLVYEFGHQCFRCETFSCDGHIQALVLFEKIVSMHFRLGGWLPIFGSGDERTLQCLLPPSLTDGR